jgi:hypothetical protein
MQTSQNEGEEVMPTGKRLSQQLDAVGRDFGKVDVRDKKVDDGDRLLARHIVATFNGGIKVEEDPKNPLRLKDVMPVFVDKMRERAHKDAVRSGPCAVVVQFDEFQREPEAVAYMLRAVVNYNNHQKPDKDGIVLLPVCTGLAKGETQKLAEQGVTDLKSLALTIPYFSAKALRADVWSLFVNAATACGVKPQWATYDEAAEPLRFLLEDTLGWAQAVVQLAGAYAEVMTSAQKDAPGTPAGTFCEDAHWEAIETRYVAQINSRYNYSRFEMLGDSATIYKLFFLALSPHLV